MVGAGGGAEKVRRKRAVRIGETENLNWMEMNDEKRGTYTYTYQDDTWIFFDNRSVPIVAPFLS